MERPGADETEAVRALLRERLGPAVGDLERLAGGEFSRAFGVRHEGRGYVVRVSAYPHSEEAFAKDDYAWRHFGSAALPIPRIVARGRHGDGFFAISERAEGGRLSELAPAAQLAHLPAT